MHDLNRLRSCRCASVMQSKAANRKTYRGRDNKTQVPTKPVQQVLHLQIPDNSFHSETGDTVMPLQTHTHTGGESG